MNEHIQLSRWCHSFDRYGVTAFFNAVTLGLVFIPEDIARSLVQLINERHTMNIIENVVGVDVFNALNEEGILVIDDGVDVANFEETRRKLLQNVTLEIMYLIVTDRCNLRCKYCFEETPLRVGPFRPTDMSIKIAKASLDFFAKMAARYGNQEKEKVVHLYGGEPLMNQKVVRFSIEYIQTLKKRGILPSTCKTAIVTNGVFISDDIAEFFAENGTTIGISIDGPQEINNRYRRSRDGGLNVFSVAMNALELLKKHRVKIGLSVTLTPEAVRQPERLIAFIIDQSRQIDGISLTPMYFNRLVPLPSDYYVRAAECQIAAFEKFREIGVYEDRVMRKGKAFIGKQPMYADCGIVGNQLVIAPDGQVGICQEFVKPRTYFRGSVLNSKFDPIAEGLFNDWKMRSPFFMESCFRCPAIGICGGGCPVSAELKTGNRWNLDEFACVHSKSILEWMIWDTYAQIT